MHMHHPEQRVDVVDEREVDEPRTALTRKGAELPGRKPLRNALRRLLLEERLARDPLTPTFHREGAVTEVRDDRLRDGAVVLEEVALRDSVSGEEDAVGRAQLDARRRFSHSAFLTANASQSLLKYANTSTSRLQFSNRCAQSSSSRSE